MNVESIAEVKVLTSGYQAEFGRSSGLQITAVTKSGTNRFRGSVYDVERNSDWNSNSKVNKLNGNPRPCSRRRTGVLVRRPDRQAGRQQQTVLLLQPGVLAPHARQRRRRSGSRPGGTQRRLLGDLDQNGRPTTSSRTRRHRPCSATDTSGCFADGGVLGRIPASALYQPGINILKLFPLPNTTGTGFNYEFIRPNQNILSWQPAARVDWQPSAKLRVTGKYSGWQQRRDVIAGVLPGFNDTQMQRPVISNLSFSGNYSLNATTFLEATYGRSRNELADARWRRAAPAPASAATRS